MKRHGNLWPQIVTWDNLLLAARYAQKGKGLRDNVLEFNYNLESNYKPNCEIKPILPELTKLLEYMTPSPG